MFPGLNTSLLFPCGMPLLQRLKETPTLKLWHFSVYIRTELMYLLCIARSPAAARRGLWWCRWSLQGQSSYEFCWGIYYGAHGLSLQSLNWMMTKHGLRHSSLASARDLPQLVIQIRWLWVLEIRDF